MVNNVGISHTNQPMLNVSEEAFDRFYQVNVKSLYVSAIHCVPEFIASIPLGRLGRPADAANAVVFFADRASDFVTGVCLEVALKWMATAASAAPSPHEPPMQSNHHTGLV